MPVYGEQTVLVSCDLLYSYICALLLHWSLSVSDSLKEGLWSEVLMYMFSFSFSFGKKKHVDENWCWLWWKWKWKSQKLLERHFQRMHLIYLNTHLPINIYHEEGMMPSHPYLKMHFSNDPRGCRSLLHVTLHLSNVMYGMINISCGVETLTASCEVKQDWEM